MYDHLPSTLVLKIKIAEGMKCFKRFFPSLGVLLDTSLTEVSGRRHLVDVHHDGIFEKLSFLV